MNIALAGSTLLVNNEVWAYVPNSLKYDKGTPERKVEPQVVGDGAVTNITSEDYSTAKSKVMFDLKTTTENEIKVDTTVANFDANLIKIISREGKSRIFENAVVINKPEFDTGADGVVSVEFESSPAVIG